MLVLRGRSRWCHWLWERCNGQEAPLLLAGGGKNRRQQRGEAVEPADGRKEARAFMTHAVTHAARHVYCTPFSCAMVQHVRGVSTCLPAAEACAYTSWLFYRYVAFIEAVCNCGVLVGGWLVHVAAPLVSTRHPCASRQGRVVAGSPEVLAAFSGTQGR